MKRLSARLLCAALLLAVLEPGCVYAPPSSRPAPKKEVVVMRPHARAAWVAGYWKWSRRDRRWVWVPGYWRYPRGARVIIVR